MWMVLLYFGYIFILYLKFVFMDIKRSPCSSLHVQEIVSSKFNKSTSILYCFCLGQGYVSNTCCRVRFFSSNSLYFPKL